MAVELYQFTSSGEQQVIRSYESIAAAAEAAGRRAAAAFDGMSGPRMTGSRGAGGRGGRSAEDKELAEFERKIKREVAAAERAEAKKAQAADRAAERAASQRRTRIRQAEDRELRDLERKLKREEQIEKRAAAARQQVREKSQEQFMKRLGTPTSALMFGAQAVGRAAMFGVGIAGAAGLYAGQRMVRNGIDLQEQATRLAIQGGRPEQAQRLREGFERTAMEVRGTRAADVAAGSAAFVTKTGDVGAAERFQNLFAETAMATGASIEDIASAAADLFDDAKFGIKDVDEMGKALATLAVQGKRGSFEIKDAASQFPKLAAAAARLGIGKGAGAVAVLGGLTQIARGATGSPEQAASAVEATFRQLVAKSPELKAVGVNVFDKKGQARPIQDVLVETISKVGGKDVAAKKVGLQKIFGEEGIRAISPLISAFTDAATRGKDGAEAMREMFAKATDAAGAEAEIRSDLAAAQSTAGAQLTQAWEAVQASITANILPVLPKFADAVSGLVEKTDWGKVADVGVQLGEFGVAVVAATGKLLDFLNLSAPGASISEKKTDIDKKMERLAAEGEGLDEQLGKGGASSRDQMQRAARLRAITGEMAGLRTAKGMLELQETPLEERAGSIGREEFLNRVGELTSRDALSTQNAANLADEIMRDPTKYAAGSNDSFVQGVGAQITDQSHRPELDALIKSYAAGSSTDGRVQAPTVNMDAAADASGKLAGEFNGVQGAATSLKNALDGLAMSVGQSGAGRSAVDHL